MTSTCLPLPQNVSEVTRKQAADLLGVKPSTLRQYQYILTEIKPDQWAYKPQDRGFSRESIECLWELRRLINTLGMRMAIKITKEEAKKYGN